MAEYIKVSDAIDWFRPYSHMEESIPFDVLVTDLQDSVPAADVAPVNHGRWVQEREIENHFLGSGTSFHCSACGRKAGHNQVKAYHYCPRCGAKMDKDGAQK